jgi:hypothetical protein
LPTFVIVTGIAGLITESVDLAVGVVLTVAGCVASGLVVKLSPELQSSRGCAVRFRFGALGYTG